MSFSRRNTDRRRRVLYTSGLAENEVSTAASRRNALLLREARNPTATYGSRVKRRIRGRWFSLVPIRRRTLVAIAMVMWGFVLCLCLAHYAAVTWPSLAGNWDVARPLRLDEPTSFGRWMMTLLLAASGGASLLIYQLRRYRIDDFQGRYRLWRLVIILCGLASLDSLVSIVEWSGALLDFAMGRRAALSGNDWVRILVALGGTVLAMRLVAEVRRSRWSLVTMTIGWMLLAIPVAAKWNFFEVNSIGRWTLVTTAPLMGTTTLFLALVGYLRLLYREVRQVEDSDSISLRIQNFRERVFHRDETEAVEARDASTSGDEPVVRRGWFRRRNTASGESTIAAPSRAQRRAEAREERERAKAEREAQRIASAAAKAQTAAAKAATAVAATDANADPATDDARPAKRRWFGRRDDGVPAVEAEVTATSTKPLASASEASHIEKSEAAPRSGLKGWFGKKKTPEPIEGDTQIDAPTRPPVSTTTTPTHPETESDEEDDADYSGMSKAERRRLRKLQRRGGNAA